MNIGLSENAETLLKILNSGGFQGYAVGGCVRDMIMKRRPYDFDITTNATVGEMLKLFSGYHCLTQGAKHGTVAVVMGNEVVECTTYRVDGKYSDGRHPDSVTFSPRLSDDLSRRDFTVNALAYNKNDGIIDLFGGIGDINNRTVRAIGDPDRRFTEDALRIMRAMRFSSTLGFTIEKNTAESMIKNAARLALISKERITSELEKMLIGENIGYVIENFGGILKHIIPDIVLSHAVTKRIERCPKEYDVRLFALVSECDDPSAALESSRLALRKTDKKLISELSHMSPPKDRTDIKRLLAEFGETSVKKYISYSGSNRLADELSGVLKSGECYDISHIDISSEKLMELGFVGHEIQTAKEEILNRIIRGELENTENEIIEYLKGRTCND